MGRDKRNVLILDKNRNLFCNDQLGWHLLTFCQIFFLYISNLFNSFQIPNMLTQTTQSDFLPLYKLKIYWNLTTNKLAHLNNVIGTPYSH